MDTDTNNAYIETVANGDAAEVTRLLDMGADIRFVNTYGDSALKLAIEKQHIEVLDVLIARDAVDFFTVDQDGLLPLNRAARGYPKSLERLLRERDNMAPAAAHKALYLRDTPAGPSSMLSAAVDSGNLECVRLVLAAGVDPYSEYLKHQMVFENKEIEAAVVGATHKFSLLNALLHWEYERALGLIDDKTIDLHTSSSSGSTALSRAVAGSISANASAPRGRILLVLDKLLACGANPNQILFQHNYSVLAEAFLNGADGVVIEKLVAAGGRVLGCGVQVADMLTHLSASERSQEERANLWRETGLKSSGVIAGVVAQQEKWTKTIAFFKAQMAREYSEKATHIVTKPKLMPKIKLRK